MNRPTVVFRCDASPSIGAGHVIRCLALAEAFADAGSKIWFAVRPGTCDVVSALRKAPVAVVELQGPTEEEAFELPTAVGTACDCLVVDQYERDRAFETACRTWARSIIALDDQTGRVHDCDVVVDAGAPRPDVYAPYVPKAARILTGPDFALLRHGIVARREESLRRRDGRPVEHLLVAFGATDPTNATSAVLDTLGDLVAECDITVAISAQAPHLEAVRARIGGRVHLVIDGDMPALIEKSDIAIGAAGASAFERGCLGLPSVIVVVADNQRGIAL